MNSKIPKLLFTVRYNTTNKRHELIDSTNIINYVFLNDQGGYLTNSTKQLLIQNDRMVFGLMGNKFVFSVQSSFLDAPYKTIIIREKFATFTNKLNVSLLDVDKKETNYFWHTSFSKPTDYFLFNDKDKENPILRFVTNNYHDSYIYIYNSACSSEHIIHSLIIVFHQRWMSKYFKLQNSDKDQSSSSSIILDSSYSTDLSKSENSSRILHNPKENFAHDYKSSLSSNLSINNNNDNENQYNISQDTCLEDAPPSYNSLYQHQNDTLDQKNSNDN